MRTVLIAGCAAATLVVALMVPPQSGRDGSDGIASADIKSGTIAVRSLHGHIARNLVINDPHVLIPNPPIEA